MQFSLNSINTLYVNSWRFAFVTLLNTNHPLQNNAVKPIAVIIAGLSYRLQLTVYPFKRLISIQSRSFGYIYFDSQCITFSKNCSFCSAPLDAKPYFFPVAATNCDENIIPSENMATRPSPNSKTAP